MDTDRELSSSHNFLPLYLMFYRSCLENLFVTDYGFLFPKMSKICTEIMPMTLHSLNN